MSNIDILGEDRFFYEKHRGGIRVTHPKWSVTGFGKSLYDAVDDTIRCALIIQDAYCSMPNEELSEEAIKLKIWLSGIKREAMPDA